MDFRHNQGKVGVRCLLADPTHCSVGKAGTEAGPQAERAHLDRTIARIGAQNYRIALAIRRRDDRSIGGVDVTGSGNACQRYANGTYLTSSQPIELNIIPLTQ